MLPLRCIEEASATIRLHNFPELLRTAHPLTVRTNSINATDYPLRVQSASQVLGEPHPLPRVWHGGKKRK